MSNATRVTGRPVPCPSGGSGGWVRWAAGFGGRQPRLNSLFAVKNLSRIIWIGYALLILGTLPWALSVWNGFLRDRIGQFLSIEEFHVLEYGVLGALAYRGRKGWVLAATLAVGLLDESVQSLLPQRHFQWSDVWLNWAGGTLGFALGWCWQGIGRLIPGWVARSQTPL